jgi:hypothetical protein
MIPSQPAVAIGFRFPVPGPPPASGQHGAVSGQGMSAEPPAVSGQGMSAEPPLTPLPDYCILVFMYT